MSFIVMDGTGDIQVRAYRDVARDLVTHGSPIKGEHVIVDGVLKVSAKGKIRLFLQGAQQVRRQEDQADND